MGTFQIQAPSPASLSVEQGTTGTLAFTVRNAGDSFRNLGLRVAVLNAVGDEDPGAASAAWFSAEGPTDAFVPAGGEVQATVTIAPPADATLGDVTFRLVAFDSDLADEDVTDGPPATLTVTPKAEEPPPPAPGIPWWVWVLVGVGALALIVGIIVGVVAGGGDDDDATANDDDSSVAVTDDDDATTAAPVNVVRQLPILFKAYEGNDPLAGPLSGVTIKVESMIDTTKTLTTNADGEAQMQLCVVTDATASTDPRCLKTRQQITMRATKSAYKNTPTTTLVVEDLMDAPKTYIEMVPAGSSTKPIRPWIIDANKPIDLEEYIRLKREALLGDGRWGKELMVEVNLATEISLVAVTADKKLDTIKVIREYTGLGLKESKAVFEAVQGGRTVPLKNIEPVKFNEVARALQAVGAKTATR